MAPATKICSPDAKGYVCPPSRKEQRRLKEQAKFQERLQELTPLQQKLSSSQDAAEKLAAVTELLSLLDKGQAAVLEAVLETELIPWLLGMVQAADNHDLQFQTLLALDKLTHGTPEQTRRVVAQGVLERLAPLLASGQSNTCELTLQILANVAGASKELRDLMVASGGATFVASMFQGTRQPSPVAQKAAVLLGRMCSWELSKVFTETVLHKLMQTLATLLSYSDEQVILESLSSLSFLGYENTLRLAVLLANGILDRLAFLLSHPGSEIQLAALRTATKIVAGSQTGMQAFLLQEPLPHLKDLLESEVQEVQHDSCELLVRILKAGPVHVRETLDAGCLPCLICMLASEDELTRYAAARGLGSCIHGCSDEQMHELLKADSVAPMAKMLEVAAFQSDSSGAGASLDFLEKALVVCQDRPREAKRVLEQMRGADGAKMLQTFLESSTDTALNKRAESMLKFLRGD